VDKVPTATPFDDVQADGGHDGARREGWC